MEYKYIKNAEKQLDKLPIEFLKKVEIIIREPLFTPFGKIEVPSAHDVRLIFGNFSCKNG